MNARTVLAVSQPWELLVFPLLPRFVTFLTIISKMLRVQKPSQFYLLHPPLNWTKQRRGDGSMFMIIHVDFDQQQQMPLSRIFQDEHTRKRWLLNWTSIVISLVKCFNFSSFALFLCSSWASSTKMNMKVEKRCLVQKVTYATVK